MSPLAGEGDQDLKRLADLECPVASANGHASFLRPEDDDASSPRFVHERHAAG
jgi:hypothetical protein